MRKYGYCFSAFAMNAVLGMCALCLPLFAKNALRADPFQIGVVSMSGVLGYILACVFCGAVSERTGRKPLILTGVILYTATYVVVSQSRALWQLCTLMVVTWLGLTQL